MAELPRYRRDNLLGAVSPQYQGLALREGARAAQALSEAMNRVSQAAFGVAQQQAKIEGIEYGAANAPTIEQLAVAKAQGKDIKEMLPGDSFTVFGSAARASATDLVTATMEIQAREQVTGVQAMYELGQIGIGEMQSRLATIEDSYSSVLSDISPTSAAKLRATIGLAGNSAFLSAAKAKVKADRQELETQISVGTQAMIDSIPTIVDAGVTVAPDGSTVTPADSVDVLRAQIMKFGGLVENGDTFVRENLRLLDAKVEETVVAYTQEFVLENPIEHERQLRTGTFKDQNMQIMFSSLSPDQQYNARKAAAEALSSTLARESGLSSRNERLRGELFDALVPQLFAAKTAGEDAEVERLLTRMTELNPDRATTQRESIYTTGGVDNAEVVSNFDLMATQGSLTVDILNEARSGKQISESSYRRYIGVIEQQRNTDHRDAMTIAENILRPGVRSMINPGDDDRKALKQLGLLENAMILEARKPGNADFDRIQFAQNWMNNTNNQGPSDAEKEQAQNKLSGLAEFLNMPTDTSPANLKAEVDRRVSTNRMTPAQAAAYTQSFRTLGVE